MKKNKIPQGKAKKKNDYRQINVNLLYYFFFPQQDLRKYLRIQKQRGKKIYKSQENGQYKLRKNEAAELNKKKKKLNKEE